MAGEGRVDRLEKRLAAMEADYRRLFIAALENCAGGVWGLFGQNEHCDPKGRYRPAAVGELRDLAEGIDELRGRLGMPAFPLHQRFEAARGPAHQNAPGEPKQARLWLDELAREPPA